ncbi:copper resistance protein B [Spartinivicinus poritis]|uniref:Copper resistance protein B n=1 Tax=Spartinivicinus poritis TaxID=2994640 RepID=A0ABT5U3D6_9GAMM|nr:copper resistance protein B [Spartinivicinus sp. A2-2]MDE1460883.1 copper resistance protein B [Spartinivicinus sp. A2-2]
MNTTIKYSLLSISLFISEQALAAAEDDPLLTKFMVNQLERREAEGDNPIAWDAQAWVGKDLHKLWLKSEGEYTNGNTEESELQLLYSRAVAPFWDFQAGWRGDLESGPERHWLALGFQGLAPYYFETEPFLFLGEHGQIELRLEAEYEMLFTQRLVLTPEIEISAFSKNDEAVGVGSGLSEAEFSLRLRYEIRREFAPYIGINWWKKYSKTADFAREEGEETDDVNLVVGIRLWF